VPRAVESSHVVYILRSESQPHRYYTGLTTNLPARLDAHNAGLNTSTASGRPWRVVTYVTFTDGERAMWFERYLKTGSG
jgi:putative endonuclease